MSKLNNDHVRLHRENGVRFGSLVRRSALSAISVAIGARIRWACVCLFLLLIGVDPAASQDANAGDKLATQTTLRDDVEVTLQTVRAPSLGQGRVVSYLMTRKKGVSGPLPVAFVYMSIPETSDPLPDLNISHPAYDEDFALRGYLAVRVIERPRDITEVFYAPKKYCTSPRIADVFQRRADYLQAVIASVASEPAIDNKHMIIVANGPAAMDSLALGSRGIPGLQAIIAIGGGIYVEGCDVISQLKPLLTRYGAKNSLPTLWIYQDNDSLYQQASVIALRDAYISYGGSADLSFLHIAGEPSYSLNFSAQGRSAFLPVIDDFLTKRNLPAVGGTLSDALARKIGGAMNRNLARKYISGPTNKALAMSSSGRVLGSSFFENDVTAAKAAALTDCRAHAKGEECRIIMINDDQQD